MPAYDMQGGLKGDGGQEREKVKEVVGKSTKNTCTAAQINHRFKTACLSWWPIKIRFDENRQRANKAAKKPLGVNFPS